MVIYSAAMFKGRMNSIRSSQQVDYKVIIHNSADKLTCHWAFFQISALINIDVEMVLLSIEVVSVQLQNSDFSIQSLTFQTCCKWNIQCWLVGDIVRKLLITITSYYRHFQILDWAQDWCRYDLIENVALSAIIFKTWTCQIWCCQGNYWRAANIERQTARTNHLMMENSSKILTRCNIDLKMIS